MACISERDRFLEAAILGNVVKAPRLKADVHVQCPERSDLDDELLMIGRNGEECSQWSGRRSDGDRCE